MLTETQNDMIREGVGYFCGKCKRVHRIDSAIEKHHNGMEEKG